MRPGLITENGNLDGADADADEVLQRIRREQSAVGEDIDMTALEAGRKRQVVDVAQEHRLPAGEGDCADGSLREEFPQRLARLGGIRRREGRAAIPPIIITEPATLVAGLCQFKYDIVDPPESHQRMLIV